MNQRCGAQARTHQKDILARLFFDITELFPVQQYDKVYVVIGSRSTPFEILGCDMDLVDGAQCKCKRKHWYVVCAFLRTCPETYYFRLSCELVEWLTIAKYQALEIFYRAHAGAVERMVGEG